MSEIERDVDCKNAARGVWLVKVPKYIAEKWEKAGPNTEAGRLTINKLENGSNDITFKLSNVSPEERIPTDHKFMVSNIRQQSMAVYSQLKTVNDDGIDCGTGKVTLEGAVSLKGECRPLNSDLSYIALKRQKIVEASQPKRSVIGLKTVVNVFKPVAAHANLKEYEMKKKLEGKKARGDKDKVLDMIFTAFEAHQYYYIRDLERITKQPALYLKELLREVCDYNQKNPHRNTYELKPEYRHYAKQTEKAEETPIPAAE